MGLSFDMSEEIKPIKPEIVRDELGRFPPGVSGNPLGKPKFSLTTILKEELAKEIEANVGGKTERVTVARALILKIVQKAIKEEDVQMMKEILNRVEGLPRQPISMGLDDDIRELEVKIIKGDKPHEGTESPS